MPAPLDDRESWERHAGAACAPLGGAYRRREPEKTVLHQVVCERLETFLQMARDRSDHGRGLPAFVERELRTAKALVGLEEDLGCEADALAALQAAEVDRRTRYPSRECRRSDLVSRPAT